MKCPYCGYAESKVIDSRPAEEGSTIRRRRECLACSKRFTTYEIIERMPLVVVKRDGSRQSFDKVKIMNGLVRACEKRPVALEQLETIAKEIETELPEVLKAPLSTDKPVGKAVVYYVDTNSGDKQAVATVNLVPMDNIGRSALLAVLDVIGTIFQSYWFIVIIVLIILVVIGYVIVNKIHRARQRKRRKVKKYRNF